MMTRVFDVMGLVEVLRHAVHAMKGVVRGGNVPVVERPQVLEPDAELIGEECVPVGFVGVVVEREPSGLLEGHLDGRDGPSGHVHRVISVDETCTSTVSVRGHVGAKRISGRTVRDRRFRTKEPEHRSQKD